MDKVRSRLVGGSEARLERKGVKANRVLADRFPSGLYGELTWRTILGISTT